MIKDPAVLHSLDATTKNGRSVHSVLIIGAGIAGIQSALDMAEAGFHVYLVEKLSNIGGHMAQLDKTFPTLDCSSCILTPKMADIARHPNITLMTLAQVESISGEPGAFHVVVKQEPRYVDIQSCTGCGLCSEACPVTVPSSFNLGLSTHKAIYRSFPQAIPAAFVIEKKPSPCRLACPAHIPVQGYISLIAQGKNKEALERILQAGVPFAGTLGRVCYHPCESVCKRKDWDEALSICGLKRFAYDSCDHANLPTPVEFRWKEKVAVVGAGPAGLTAAFGLANRGYAVTVFDALPVAGGMLSVGIPAYRLPRDVLEHEVNQIRSLGVDIRLNTPIGKSGGPGLSDLLSDYQAIFVAVGAHQGSQMKVDGEDAQGVFQAVTFLRDLNLGKPVRIGKRVVVIGGGNSAIDAARCALRLGSEVQILYRRTRTEMPAASWEVDAAEAEGVTLNFLLSPTRVISNNGVVSGIECQRMQLGEPDSSGRRRPVAIPNSEFTIQVDTVIAAIGQRVEAATLGLSLNHDQIVADPVTLQTSNPAIFAGGDAVLGPSSVVEAVGNGIRAAESIHRFLRGENLTKDRQNGDLNPRDISVIPSHLPIPAKRTPMHELSPAERRDNFAEVEKGYTSEQAMEEAARCLACAVCAECLQCEAVCQREAIKHGDKIERHSIDVGAVIVSTGFATFDPMLRPELGYGKYPQVITTLEFERLVSASGPTSGKILIQGKSPKRIVFIQCVGSRDQRDSLGEGGIPYCSRVCCMVVAKQAHLAHDRLPGAEITVLYMDIRAFGKGFEEFYDRVRKEGILYRRGNPSEIIQRGSAAVMRVEDTLSGEIAEIEADLVVLAVGMTSQPDEEILASTITLQRGKDGFYEEKDSKVRTMESQSPGIFLAGCCQGPKDIPDTVAHGKAAAAAAMILLKGFELKDKSHEEQELIYA